ncbi:anion transporter [Archaeoglobus veneficus]|uniref:Citrate transporter n=1 Tax=Archaeoglobus veneficus (strain DSM 11195 / SNP6) TaxID=693661 RepID=F2KMH4_ARCVS|nr:anion transporter [Archaeoglobus veneficus]AEA47171.1 Citrate transporter [Archaeoglobus veneficus SNP6]
MIELAIFIITYFLISVQNVRGIKLDRPAASTVGAALTVALGVLSLEEAVHSIDYNTIILLFSMMVLSAYFGIAGFFDYVACKILKKAGSGRKLLLMVVVTSGFLSALFVNDTICVFMTPVVIRLALAAGMNPVPLLIALVTSANIGSAATIIGNPQNMLIGIASGIPFTEFTVNMLPPSIVGLVLCYLLVYLIYRKEFERYSPGEIVPKVNRGLALRTAAVFALVLTLFVTEVYPIPLSALIGAATMFVVGGVRPKEVLERVDWTLLLLFSNLFIVMHGFEKEYGEYLISLVHAGDSLASSLTLSAITVVGSNLVSNVPYVMMVLPALKAIDGKLWYIVAMASTFAGNLTLIGSVANLIVAETAERYGIAINFGEYLKVGVPLTILTVLVGTIIVYYM